jgi:putative membrane protein
MGYGYGPGWGMMNGWGYGDYGYGFGAFHMVIWVVILIAIVAFVVWLVRSTTGPGMHPMPPRRSSGLDVLEERYARGEINRDEYLQKKKDING